ncbi:MAG: hypothetical protein JW836_03355 [Deltaproteobacteria bacterium]|nr:hypothetical protein [Deltaproteobacteria bacterium]
MIGYLLIQSGRLGSCIFAFVLGMLVDLFAAGVPGLFALIYLLVFLSIELGSRLFDLQTIKGPMILVFLGALVRQFCLVGLLDIFAYRVHFSANLFLGFAVSAAATGAIAPFVFFLFDRIKTSWPGQWRESL